MEHGIGKQSVPEMDERMNQHFAEMLAKCIIRTAGRRGGSYDKEAADKATHADFSRFYRISIEQAAHIECKSCQQFTYLVANFLYASWNDALDWAHTVYPDYGDEIIQYEGQ